MKTHHLTPSDSDSLPVIKLLQGYRVVRDGVGYADQNANARPYQFRVTAGDEHEAEPPPSQFEWFSTAQQAITHLLSLQ